MKKTPLAYARELHAALLEAERAEARGLIRNFLAGLARTRKSHLKPRILEAFRWVALAAEGRRAGRVVTARPLGAEARARLGRRHKDVVFEERVDPSLLGGAIVEIEDTRLDGSVRGRLAALTRALERGA